MKKQIKSRNCNKAYFLCFILFFSQTIFPLPKKALQGAAISSAFLCAGFITKKCNESISSYIKDQFFTQKKVETKKSFTSQEEEQYHEQSLKKLFTKKNICAILGFMQSLMLKYLILNPLYKTAFNYGPKVVQALYALGTKTKKTSLQNSLLLQQGINRRSKNCFFYCFGFCVALISSFMINKSQATSPLCFITPLMEDLFRSACDPCPCDYETLNAHLYNLGLFTSDYYQSK